jgi:pyrophosphate--fructose-6-phosphate 1-phosphotransferase
MGREASHISLECALQTHPNCVVLGEEVAQKKHSLRHVTNLLADMITQRANLGKNYGVVLIPEGLIEFMSEIKSLLHEMNDVLAADPTTTHVQMLEKLSTPARDIFEFLPTKTRKEMMLERDPHGNVQVSKIETERLLMTTVEEELKKRAAAGKYKGSFAALAHFFGYEGRSVEPSNFDCNYCYTLGHTIGALIEHHKTGLVAVVRNLTHAVKAWEPCGTPVAAMLNIEHRKGKDVPVIKKALVNLDDKPFKLYKSKRLTWLVEDHYSNPGGLQFAGAGGDLLNMTIQLEQDKTS